MCFKENADLSECLGAYVMDENGLVPVPDRETDAVAALLRRIDALPTVDSIYEDVPGDSDPEYAKWFSDMEQVLRDIRKAKEAYDALADEEREQIDAESVDKLMGLWNLAERLEEMRPLADMASGTSGTCSWVIDANGTMTISPSNGSSGELEELASAVSQGWNAYKENIKKVVVRQGVKTPKNAANLFYGLTSCTEMDISGLDTSATESFLGFFDSCKITELDISHMNTDKAVNMKWMFKGCSALTALDISRLNTQNVTNMIEMFKGSGLISLDIRNLNVRNVTDMSKMFNSCSNLESVNLSGLQAPELTTMKSMFEGCRNLTSVNLSGMDIPRVTDMAAMFSSCTNLTILNFDQINAPSVQKMSSMFSSCSNLTELDLTPLRTVNVTGMSSMFRQCASLTTLDITTFDTQNVTDMSQMFYGCKSLTELDLSSFATSNVTNMGYMFNACTSLTDLTFNTNKFNIQNVTDMNNMFNGCSNLAAMDISNFEFKNGVNCMSMLSSCKVGINTKTYNSRWGASKLYIYNKYDYTALSNTTLTAEDAKTNRILVFKPRVVTPTVIGNGTVSYSGKYGNKTASDVVYKDYYKKTALLGEKDTFDPEKFYAQQGEDLTITYTPAAKCEVSEVMVNGTKIDLAENPTAYTIKDIRANTTVSVKFRASSVTVKFNSNGGSPVGDFTGDVDGKVTKPADPTRSGYNFAGWYKDAALKQEWDFENSTLDGDTTLYAKWVENIPPQISVSAPPDGWQNQNVVLTLTFSDNVGVTKLFVKMDQGAYSEINSFGASPYKYTVTQEGAHSYTFKAQDAAGNYAETAAVTVKLDKTAPTISGAGVSEIGKESAKAAFTSNDTGTYHYMIKKSTETAPSVTDIVGSNTAAVETANREITFQVEGLTPRTNYVLYLAVVDKAGNKSGRTSVSFTTQKPDLVGTVTVNNISPRYGDVLEASAELTVVEPGALSYEWYRDGIKIAGAAGNTYTAVKADAGKAIRAAVKAENYGGSISSKATKAVGKRQLTVTAAAEDKVYDGSVEAVVKIQIAEGRINGDTVGFTADGAFSDANAGKDKTVTVSNITINGADQDYYELKETPSGPRADISKAKGPAAPQAEGVDETYPEAGDGKITGLTEGIAYEISTDGSLWTDVALTGTAVENLGAGAYWIREKETENYLEGEAAQVAVGTVPPVPMDTPQAVFEASDMTISNLKSNMRYSLDGGDTWTEVEDGTEVVLAEDQVDISWGIQVIQNGNHTTFLDSEAQIIGFTRAEAPSGIGTAPETYVDSNDGKLEHVTSEMEYRLDSEPSWTDAAVREASDLSPGAYYVRVKGEGTMLPSAEAGPYIVEKYVVKPVTGVKIKPSEVTLGVGGSADLTAVLEPSDATYQNVTWSSSDPAVASVSAQGVVTALGTGNAVVTVKTEDAGKTADCRITVKVSGGISGIVRENGHPIAMVTVEVRQGGTDGTLVGKPVVTAEDGAYKFEFLPCGIYSLVARRTPPGGKLQVITRIVEIGDEMVNSDIDMPDGDKSTIVEVQAGTPPVAADHLNDLYRAENLVTEDESGITQEDLDKLAAGGSVEIKLTAKQKEREDQSVKEDVEKIESGAGSGSELMILDLKVLKTVTEAGQTSGSSTRLTSLPQLIKIVIPVEGLSDKVNIQVLRIHEGVVQKLPDGEEYFEVSGDNMILHVSKFSTYGLAYDTAGSASGHGGGSGSGEIRTGRWIQNDVGWWYEYVNRTWPSDGWYFLPWKDSWKWYHFNREGYMESGWYTDKDGKQYYLHPYHDGDQGYMYTGWNMIDGAWYYFEPRQGREQGLLYVNRVTPDGYTVNDEGVWVQ